MTNAEIIGAECVLRGITETCHTYSKWKSLGYAVRRGEKAKFSVPLWKKTGRKKETEDDTEANECGKMYLCKSFLFGESQVEKVEEK